MTGIPAIDRPWTRLRDRLRTAIPELDVTLRRDDLAGVCPTKRSAGEHCRQFAWCDSGPPIVVEVAGRLGDQPARNIEGVLAHELGHAVLFHVGLLDHTEREADEAAGLWLSVPIAYDADDVQTTGPGTSPRPRRLG